MKRSLSLLMLTATLAFSQAGVMGGSEGLHQLNANTLGQWRVNAGAGGNFAVGSWALSRGGVFEAENRWKRYEGRSFNDMDFSHSSNLFVAVGVLDFVDVGASLPFYYDYAKSDKVGGSGNMWSSGIGDLDLFAKVGLPFASTGVLRTAFLFDAYVPTGTDCAGVRPRHAWYLNGSGNTHPYTADDWAFGAGLAFTFDFGRLGVPLTWNLAASFVYPLADGEASTLVYSSGVNWNVLPWMTPFLEFSAEMRLQDNGAYEFDPMVDPMLLTPGVRFHLPYNIEFGIGVDVAVRAIAEGFDHDADVDGGKDHIVQFSGEYGTHTRYGYASAPFFAGVAVLSVAIDAKGKSADSDGDGVSDENDKCARTPSGAKVDADGCPDNSDSLRLAREKALADSLAREKAIADSLTREKALADSLARLDTDSDGVTDNQDSCPNTPAGVQVGADGCPKDFDGDGVPDYLDKCPNTLAGIAVDSTGCAPDSDHDGVPDYLDKCQGTPSGRSVDSLGCLPDFDHDGVPDFLDKCPNSEPGIAVDSVGCTPDSDRDGIPDYKDKCPGSPAGQAVDSLGCLPDFDHDGVPDNLDKCPNTLPGIVVDKSGCPVNKKEDLDQLKKGIQFKTGSANLTKSSYGTLDGVAALMQKIPTVNLEVQGHTDNKGKESKNLHLSETRAQAVVDYLVEKGIAAERLRAVGYGSSKPIASNKKNAGRAQNRRVELVPFEK